MVLTKALVLKGVIGATTIAVPASLMVAYRKEISSYFSPSNLTKFDQGLIDYLNAGGDIQFKVTKESATTNLTETDLVFSQGNLTIVTQVKVSVGEGSGADANGTLTDASGESVDKKAQKSTLQKLNGSDNGTAWTWICEIQFTSKDQTKTNIEKTTKEKILKGTNEGLFGFLMNSSNKEIKKNFIKNCAEERKNKTFNTDNNEIKTSKEDVIFEFQQEEGKDDLTPSDTEKFNKWFSNTTNNNT